MTETEQIQEIYCPDCGYDLRQIASDRCPECGMVVDRSKLGESIIPWVHRKKLGRFRAFWRTCALVNIHPERLAREMTAAARLDDAIRFRRIVTLLALVPVVVAFIAYEYSVVAILQHGEFLLANDPRGSALQHILGVLALPCAAAAIYAITGAAGYFFAPKSLTTVQQNRAIALSYYACAPLAYLPGMLLVLWVVGAAASLMERRGAGVIITGGLVVIVLAIVLVYPLMILRTPAVLLRAITHCGAERQALVAALLPLIWLLNVVLFVGGILSCVAMLGVIALSFLH